MRYLLAFVATLIFVVIVLEINKLLGHTPNYFLITVIFGIAYQDINRTLKNDKARN